ncbi:c-type cytochrome [Azospira restricta]|uniref:C-type cytochrome n=1 Tax=Azospira restricta TaxID=404405 RepID=A0A974SQY1_9RHOO|nr:c-type cytochrome [Azospira restricta]QRJ64868.1 c-type cytochrome [Azospira restricta]
MKRQLILAALLLAPLAAPAAEAPEIVAGTCAKCHGADGIAAAPATPHLNGQLPNYLAETMQKFQSGRRPTSVADHIPATLGAEQLAAIAAHYADSTAIRPKQETDAAKVQRGSALYFSRCVDCHAESGRVGDDDAPIMNAQELTHLLTQIKAFTDGKRKFVSLMRDSYRDLGTDDLESIAHYLASIEQYENPGKKKKKKRR